MGARATALALSLVLMTAAPAAAQTGEVEPIGPPQRGPAAPESREILEFRMPSGDLRRPGDPRRSGLVAAYPIADNLQIGIGRFQVIEMDGRRTHMENERSSVTRSRDRAIAAVGIRLHF